MTVEDDLMEQERVLWEATARADGDYYRANVADDAVFVFPFFLMDRSACADAVDASGGWSRFAIEEPRVIRFGSDAGIVVYKATAHRESAADPYVAYMSTAYVRQDGSWKVAFHQQTPIDEASD